jgi:preprotein translocase subunit SecD
MQRRLVLPLVSILVIAVGALAANLVAGNSPALGLDLQGGISVTQEPVGEAGVDYTSDTLDLAVERIRERVDGLGVAEPEILRQGDAIVVNLPGVRNQQEAIDLVQVTGQVYLRGVLACQGEGVEQVPATTVPGATTPASSTPASSVPSSSTPESTVPEVTSTGDGIDESAGGSGRWVAARTASTPTTDPAATDTTDASTETTVVTDGGATTVPGTQVPVPVDEAAPFNTIARSDPNIQQELPVQGGGTCFVSPAGGTGAVFENDAIADIIQGGWGVVVSLKDGADGNGVWNQLAAECFNRGQTCPSGRLAIELDGLIVSAPSVNEPQFSGSVQITGSFTETEARNLARVLQSGSLPVAMQLQSVQNVSPTLGKDSLRAAIIAGAIGVALVLMFLLLYYKFLGLVAVAGLTVSGLLLYSVVSLLSRTQGLALSLAGVAGIIVSVGVTIDSYVVFFERLKDEIRSGRTMRNSTQRAFDGAWRTILVADTVSLIGAFTLWYLTVGSVRNFAFFLGLSTLMDLIVAWFFTRPTMMLLARTKFMARRKVMGIEVSTALDPKTAKVGAPAMSATAPAGGAS